MRRQLVRTTNRRNKHNCSETINALIYIALGGLLNTMQLIGGITPGKVHCLSSVVSCFSLELSWCLQEKERREELEGWTICHLQRPEFLQPSGYPSHFLS